MSDAGDIQRGTMGRKGLRYWLSVLPVLTTLSTTALADPQIGSVVQRQFTGAVGTRTASQSAEELTYTHDVFAGEKVNTPDGASTVLRFSDQTQLQVGANSSLVLDSFVYDPNGNAVSGSIKVAKGALRYISGWASNDRGLQIATPTATLLIRGTKFVLYVASDGSTTVGVLEGEVDVKPCGGGNTISAKSGQGVEVGPDCATSSAFVGGVSDDPAVRDDYSVSGVGTTPGHGGSNGNGGGGPRGGGSGGTGPNG
jgi:hypothetical protein